MPSEHPALRAVRRRGDRAGNRLLVQQILGAIVHVHVRKVRALKRPRRRVHSGVEASEVDEGRVAGVSRQDLREVLHRVVQRVQEPVCLPVPRGGAELDVVVLDQVPNTEAVGVHGAESKQAQRWVPAVGRRNYLAHEGRDPRIHEQRAPRVLLMPPRRALLQVFECEHVPDAPPLRAVLDDLDVRVEGLAEQNSHLFGSRVRLLEAFAECLRLERDHESGLGAAVKELFGHERFVSRHRLPVHTVVGDLHRDLDEGVRGQLVGHDQVLAELHVLENLEVDLRDQIRHCCLRFENRSADPV
mmetsp:Transcript_48962/g.116591  ORF Transcript_48962/g.116591 Transcript_48962/m.116591 type:complete len:301 (+) Transcript_48962:134-1036(+)